MGSTSQDSILAPPSAFGHVVALDLVPGVDPRAALGRIGSSPAARRSVVGVGAPLVLSLGAKLAGLRAFPAISGPGCAFPSTQGSLWIYVSGDDATDVHDRACELRRSAGDAFVLREEVAMFKYAGGRDLSGYEDGTENPKDERAIEAAIVSGAGAGLDGSSFVAVQRWVHDLEAFARFTKDEQDRIVGRERVTNEELKEAPAYAHVKRTAQESFDPPAFMVRRSLPWGGVAERGLYFVAYVRALDAFERMLRRMAGEEDGVVDGLMRFSRATSGGYYWCPPRSDAHLDWSAIGA